MEIVLRLIAHGTWYIMDVWNFADATVVIISTIFKFMKLDSEQVKVLRILRLLRFVLVLRKASAEKKRPHHGGQGLQFSSPVERVLEIFREIQEIKSISTSMRDQVKWASDIISSNKLYSISVDADKNKAEGTVFLEREVQSWVRLASEAGNETGSRDNGLENFLTS